ncbi:Bis(5'-adenosyl)-triphosphatase [Carex littledalei]|uniref:Bis(5'-adenosyl)-triphosphatase n=1 Tax=Carex littledalei TaxID=544730 RepID=A0A833R8D3_9POAL|nr:Bis(5'-adenosyl)-triphosphatase [Carex littledalei]
MEEEREVFTFGPYKKDRREVFYSTLLSYALVNIRPVLPGHILFPLLEQVKFCLCFHVFQYRYQFIFLLSGMSGLSLQHVLIIPRREVKRFPDLTDDEICDLWTTARLVGSRLEKYHNATSLTLNIQDGPEAGQSVAHVHIHVVPRKVGDFERNDDIYDALDEKEKALKKKLDLDIERKDRTIEEMVREADIYRSLLV